MILILKRTRCLAINYLTLPKERRAQAKLAIKDEYTFDFAELSPEYSEHELINLRGYLHVNIRIIPR